MNRQLIMVSSITYAMKGRDLLRSKGMKAYIERTPGHMDRVGCGYSIYVNGDINRAEAILRDGNIKIIGLSEEGDTDDLPG